MKKRRKQLTAALLALACILLPGCASAKEDVRPTGKEPLPKVRIAALKGPTAIGMSKLMAEAKAKTAQADYEFTVAGTADEFTAALLKGEIQIAAVPCNLAANLYNKSGGKIRVLGINTLGVLYVVENGNSINSIQDLKGKTIYTTGKGTTPEYTLRYLLQKAGLDTEKDVTIEFKSEATEVAALLAAKTGEPVIAMLPQPYVTTVSMQNTDVRIALDVTREWEKLAGTDSTVVTGVVVVNTAYAEEQPQLIRQFIEEYKTSVKYVNEHVEEAAVLVEEADIFKAEVAKRAIPYCNITFIDGVEMQKKISAYLAVLYEQNPASIGGSMPGDDFWYQ